jgi:hypothetical protein
MGLALCLVSFAVAVIVSRRSVGDGLGFALGVGCIYGWLRANLPDGATHFLFDSALTGIYVGVLPRLRIRSGTGGNRLLTWTAILITWPLIILLVSPFLETQHVIVQMAGLRNAVLFVPLILVGSVLSLEDWNSFTSWAQWCVIGVSGFAGAELLFGLEQLFPFNEVTKNIYVSNDIIGGFYRIPASFTSAHAYGGTMLALIPLFLGRLEEIRPHRWLTFTAVALASLGVFVCGARLPVVLFSIVMLGSLPRFGKRPGVLLLLILSMAVVGYSVSQSNRLRRFETLADPEIVTSRVSGSVNMTFVEILRDYPMGKGLGSAFGTSVPQFLADYARPPVGIENEFGRLLVEEGIPGLLLWVAFVCSILGLAAPGIRRQGSRAVGMWLVCAGTWATGLIGAGLLASIPGTLLLMLYFGKIGKTTPRGLAKSEAQWSRALSNVLTPF